MMYMYQYNTHIEGLCSHIYIYIYKLLSLHSGNHNKRKKNSILLHFLLLFIPDMDVLSILYIDTHIFKAIPDMDVLSILYIDTHIFKAIPDIDVLSIFYRHTYLKNTALSATERGKPTNLIVYILYGLDDSPTL